MLDLLVGVNAQRNTHNQDRTRPNAIGTAI
jgi:hypothetical protein